jgi:lysophospholipase L1-like esterase
MNTRCSIGAAVTVVVLIAVTVAAVRTIVQSSSASATSGTTVLTKKTSVLYLDIGASVSVGVQPTPRDPRGQPTNRGYANRLVTLESSKGVTLRLTQLGCPGESIAAMIHGPDPCYVSPDTQLSDAVAFLRVHHNAVTLVTVDLGFNTLNVCFRHLDIDLTCVTPQLTLLRQQLGQVMRTLTRAAGPHVAFVGLGHYNPYLTKSTSEGAAETFAGNSVVALHLMNLSLSQVYGSFKISLADVSKAFHEEDTSLVRVSKKENTTANVQYECRLTWMCAPKPFGPNIHPNDAGYLAIAKAVAAVLPPRI